MTASPLCLISSEMALGVSNDVEWHQQSYHRSKFDSNTSGRSWYGVCQFLIWRLSAILGNLAHYSEHYQETLQICTSADHNGSSLRENTWKKVKRRRKRYFLRWLQVWQSQVKLASFRYRLQFVELAAELLALQYSPSVERQAVPLVTCEQWCRTIRRSGRRWQRPLARSLYGLDVLQAAITSSANERHATAC